VGGKSKSIACKASGLIAEAAALALKFKVGKGSLDPRPQAELAQHFLFPLAHRVTIC